MVSDETVREVYFRDGKRCVCCDRKEWLSRKPHHCFFRSEYFKDDRDNAWNLVIVCMECDMDIHHRGNKEKQKICKLQLNRNQTSLPV